MPEKLVMAQSQILLMDFGTCDAIFAFDDALHGGKQSGEACPTGGDWGFAIWLGEGVQGMLGIATNGYLFICRSTCTS